MATREFEATTRIPTRPLSYANKDMAYNKELMVDYTTGNVYVKGEDGTIYDISEHISNIIIENPTFTEALKVTYTDFNDDEVTVTINEAIIDLVAQIKENTKVIDALTSGSGSGSGVTIQIKPGDIITDANHQFVTNTQLTEMSQKVTLKYVTCTLTTSGWSGSSAPYTQTVSCSGATASMNRPTIDINHTSSETYENAMKVEDAWCNIYRAVTGDGTITVYASEKPTVNISMVVELKLTGLTGV